MKRVLALAFAAACIGPAVAQTSVGVSIGINQPGIYGRINIGDVPRPALILPQPVIITPGRYMTERQPIYLYVPPTHQQDWHRYCGRYNACGQPVYFVRDQWVRERYEHEHPGWDRDRHRGRDKQDDHRERDRDNERNGDGRGHRR
ncbi:MAG: hypothetical protein HY021_02715 [Burkholderiales bacterium]|nr:hypothetical protein [Burkholderiales bacterium]